MARSKRPVPAAIGATQDPDLGTAELEAAEVVELAAGFELEGVRLQSPALGGMTAGSGRIEQAHLREASLDDSKLRGVQLVDVEAERLGAANGDWSGASLRRVAFREARLTGLDLGEARIEEARLVGCKLDYANFRHAVIEHASFEDCVLTNADFQGAQLYSVRFSGCQLGAADFTKAELSHVDFRGSDLALAGSVLGLQGAIIDPLQLMDLSPTIAHELGIRVEEK
jgi:uncharacterized protein YjbI with pentapeptide repeats